MACQFQNAIKNSYQVYMYTNVLNFIIDFCSRLTPGFCEIHILLCISFLLVYIYACFVSEGTHGFLGLLDG